MDANETRCRPGATNAKRREALHRCQKLEPPLVSSTGLTVHLEVSLYVK